MALPLCPASLASSASPQQLGQLVPLGIVEVAHPLTVTRAMVILRSSARPSRRGLAHGCQCVSVALSVVSAEPPSRLPLLVAIVAMPPQVHRICGIGEFYLLDAAGRMHHDANHDLVVIGNPLFVRLRQPRRGEADR
jgi:hypothetical protein